MASLSDMILKQVVNSASAVQIPSNIKDQVLGGLADSFLGSLKKTATVPGGIDIIKNLLTGKADAATSPVTSLATNLFNTNILSKLNLDKVLKGALVGLVPVVAGKLGNILKDQDGDGDVDFNDIILALTGKGNASASKTSGGGLLGAATSILGGLLGRKK